MTTPTDLRDYLVVYGLPLAILVPATLGAAWRVLAWRGGPSPAALGFVARPAGAAMMPRALVGALALIVGAAVAAAVAPPVLGALRLGRPAWLESGATPPVLGTRAWLAALLLCTAPVLLSARVSRQAWFAAWVTAVALAVSLGTELVYVRDHLAGGDWYRMNTVFKFGLQVWVLVGLAAALSLPRALRALRRAGIVAETLGYVGLMALALLALVFPAVGVPSRTAYRFPVSPGPTLDGLAFMRDAVYVVDPSYLGLPEGSFQPVPIALRDDGEAIDWLLANVPGAPVVLQSSAEFYRLYGVRVAANTGLPTVVSPLHEAEQRDPAAVYARDGDVQRIYRTADEAEALDLLREYRVEYVYVGPIERLIYGDAGAEKFAAMARAGGPLAVAFRNAGVTIYRVRPAAAPQASPAPSGAGSDASLRALEQRLAAAPADIAAAWQLAARYGERGRFADAARVLEAPARANPSDAGLLQYYADMLDRAGRRADSRAAYRQAAAAEPSAANYTRLGAALLTWGEVDEAERALTRAAELGPTEPDAYFFLGQLAEERGDRDGAADHYRRYLELAPEDADMRGDAEGALQRLGR